LKEGVEVGERAGCLFRVKRLAIDGDFEHATAARYQSEGPDTLFEREQLFRQTDGTRFVVSSRTIFDDDVECHAG
jgi:hypothetical protein